MKQLSEDTDLEFLWSGFVSFSLLYQNFQSCI